jgi:hypothetical protein
MATTVYNAAATPGAAVASTTFSITAGGSAAIRLKGVAGGKFRATLEFADGGTVVYQGEQLVLCSTNNVVTVVQAGDYRFGIVNPDGDVLQIEVY